MHFDSYYWCLHLKRLKWRRRKFYKNKNSLSHKDMDQWILISLNQNERLVNNKTQNMLFSIGGDTTDANAEPTKKARKSKKGVLPHKSNDVSDTLLDPRLTRKAKKNKAMLQLDDMRVEVSRREQEIMQMATKMKTLEEQHQDYQKHIAVLKESLCAKEEHYTMLQTDVSSAHHMANRKVKEGGLKAPESAAAPHRKQRCWYSCFTMLSNISGNSSQICNPFLFKQGNCCFPSCFAGQLRRGKEVRTSDSFGCVRFVGH